MLRGTRSRWVGVGAGVAAMLCLLAVSTDGAARAAIGDAHPIRDWVWPVAGPVTIVEPYRQPPHRYGAGHRGVDVASTGDVRAPADGVVAFVGQVAGRRLLTISHPGDLVTTLEPVTASVVVGDEVTAGQVVGATAVGGHTSRGAVHFGVRLAGEYINPLLLVGDVPRAILLPCCE